MDLICLPDCSLILCRLLPQEDCDLENVWLMGGLSVLTSVPGGPPMVCLLCASKGLHEVGSPFFSQLLHMSIRSYCLISWALSAGSHALVSWPHTVPIVHSSTPSWYSAKCAVTLSIHSAWRKLSGLCPNIMIPGAADAASSATSVGAKAGDPRFVHRSYGSGWRHRGGGYSCGSRSCHCCFSSTSNSIS